MCQDLIFDRPSNIYPNVILLLMDANDNRFDGPNSALGKNLRAIRELQLVDPIR